VRSRPLQLVPWAVLLVFVVWFASLSPSHDRDWIPEQARLARAQTRGDHVSLSNVRSFRWRSATDRDERWVSRELDLTHVRGLDVIVSSWGWDNLVHTIVSWDIEGQEPLAISIESRRERGEDFDPLLGFLRQFELIYVVADEADVVALRASHRREQVHLFRTSTSADAARRLLVAYLEELEAVGHGPAVYASLWRECSTAARGNVAEIGRGDTWDWRVVLNGHVDELLYERGLLDDSLSLDALRRASDVTERARSADGDPGFSTLIRDGVPEPRRDPS